MAKKIHTSASPTTHAKAQSIKTGMQIERHLI